MREGRHWLFNPLLKHRVDVVSQRAPWLEHGNLDMIVKSGLLGERATVRDLKDHSERSFGSTVVSAASCRQDYTHTGMAFATFASKWLTHASLGLSTMT